ncbi:hypothetical protein IFR04_011506 [Cadophora malorum]|uniref:V-type proton ATPase subunit e n=1 Tax=Cadophora malorum TaxID=108018 RepID=A0A8H7T922_9HELO|nr:hypothetical protein IFR04_011506 [Cadophora malorum]
MANGWSIIIGFVVVALACVAGWFLAPKGETQTIWRSSLILSFASCYIMWGMVHHLSLNAPSASKSLMIWASSNYVSGTMAPTHRTASVGPEKSYCEGLMREDDGLPVER